MISSQAKDSFERIFERAARSRLVADDSHLCQVERAEPGTHKIGKNEKVVVLTISSISFRLLLGLHFSDDEATRRYFVKGDDERPLADAFMEVANLCCGAINQALVEHFPDMGMSTPYVLASACIGHLDQLHPAFETLYDIVIEGSVRLAATLCVSAHDTIDFVADTSSSELQTSGELELF
ncbi:hypothetical protein [Trinickia sp. EG282A]|uniref:hypothetical protein n=1 Tax=Trinickia sp. EG282A TaxID=3237013 RepID=UPI0034D265C9